MEGRRDERLRLHALSEGIGDLARLAAWCDHVLDTGIRSLRLREPNWATEEYLRACERLRPRCEAYGALLLVTEHVECVLAGLADGLQVGSRTPSAANVRSVIGSQAWLGFSAHDPAQLAKAHAAGCDFALLSPVWSTASKPDQAPLGTSLASDWTKAAALPVLWLGGVDDHAADAVRKLAPGDRPYGLAAITAFAGGGAASTVARLRQILGAPN
ncbi:MAG: hypothetical protein RL398_1592 [Planctomycetota bacterium]